MQSFIHILMENSWFRLIWSTKNEIIRWKYNLSGFEIKRKYLLWEKAIIYLLVTLIESDFMHIGNIKFKLMCISWYCIIQKSIKDFVSCNTALFIGYLDCRFHDIQFIHGIIWIETLAVSVTDRKIDIISYQKYFMHRYLRYKTLADYFLLIIFIECYRAWRKNVWNIEIDISIVDNFYKNK